MSQANPRRILIEKLPEYEAVFIYLSPFLKDIIFWNTTEKAGVMVKTSG